MDGWVEADCNKLDGDHLVLVRTCDKGNGDGFGYNGRDGDRCACNEWDGYGYIITLSGMGMDIIIVNEMGMGIVITSGTGYVCSAGQSAPQHPCTSGQLDDCGGPVGGASPAQRLR